MKGSLFVPFILKILSRRSCLFQALPFLPFRDIFVRPSATSNVNARCRISSRNSFHRSRQISSYFSPFPVRIVYAHNYCLKSRTFVTAGCYRDVIGENISHLCAAGKLPSSRDESQCVRLIKSYFCRNKNARPA